MLQKYLEQTLILISDDANFEKLKKASAEVVKRITKNKSKILSYTLTSLDPNISPDSSDITEVKIIISEKWATFSSNYKDTPLTYIRAVMLDALDTVSSVDINIACLIWFTGRNIQKYLNITAKERVLTSDFLLFLGERIEKEAIEVWSKPTNSKTQNGSLGDLKEVVVNSIDKDTLKKFLLAASASPTYISGGENPSATQSYEQWSVFFSEKSAQGISDFVNKNIKEQVRLINLRQNQLQESTHKLLSQVQSDISGNNNISQIQTQLLWWKEACYSSSAKKSYRELDAGILQFLLAKDYSDFIPIVYPPSIDFFLKETHNGLATIDKQCLALSEIFESMKKSKTILQEIIAEPIVQMGRISLLDFIKGYVWEKYNMEQFEQLVGFSTSKEIQLSDFALWLFHDLHSTKILKQ